MVFLAMTRQGFESYCQLSSGNRASVWISGGVLAPQELSELRARGLDVTNFGSEIHPGDVSAVADAIATIRGHHPNQPIWVEG